MTVSKTVTNAWGLGEDESQGAWVVLIKTVNTEKLHQKQHKSDRLSLICKKDSVS